MLCGLSQCAVDSLKSMNCPTDGTTLLMSERHGIEIDYCPQCRGIWLDRGELDKILERVQNESQAAEAPAAAPMPPTYQQPVAPARYQEPRYEEPRYGDPRAAQPRYDDRRDPRYSDGKYRKKKSPFEFLGDLFE